jgi:sugar-specific transcriptional regulator TrmB
MSTNLDETEGKLLLKRLEEVGLSDKEARVYVALLPHKDVGSSKLIQATGLHGQFVYDALEKLEAKGLAKHVVQRGRKKFTAGSPARILSLLEEKRLSAQSIVRQLQERYAGAHEQDFEVYQGESAFIAHQMEQMRALPERSTLDVIAAETEKYMATFEMYGMAEEYERVRTEKKIHVRYIGTEAQRARLESMDKERECWTYKILPGHCVGLMSIEIHPSAVNFVTYGEPILDYTVLNAEIANGYRQFFESLWNLSSK